MLITGGSLVCYASLRGCGGLRDPFEGFLFLNSPRVPTGNSKRLTIIAAMSDLRRLIRCAMVGSSGRWRHCKPLEPAGSDPLQGSSHYDLPTVLWKTANIGIHPMYHLCSPIPYPRLPRALRDHPEFGPIGRLTWRESLCVQLALWDEKQHRLVSFRDARALP